VAILVRIPAGRAHRPTVLVAPVTFNTGISSGEQIEQLWCVRPASRSETDFLKSLILAIRTGGRRRPPRRRSPEIHNGRGPWALIRRRHQPAPRPHWRLDRSILFRGPVAEPGRRSADFERPPIPRIRPIAFPAGRHKSHDVKRIMRDEIPLSANMAHDLSHSRLEPEPLWAPGGWSSLASIDRQVCLASSCSTRSRRPVSF